MHSNNDVKTSDFKYIKIVVRPDNDFKEFKTVRVGSQLYLKRVYGLRPDCRWILQSWIVSKRDFYIDQSKILAKNKTAELFLSKITQKHLLILEV